MFCMLDADINVTQFELLIGVSMILFFVYNIYLKYGPSLDIGC